MAHVANQDEDLEVTVRLKPGDLRQATGFLNFGVKRLIYFALCAVFMAAYGAAAVAWTVSIAIILVVVVTPCITAAFAMRNTMYQAPFHHTFSSSGITSTFQGGNATFDWSLLKKARETRQHIAIWGKHGMPMMIPKRELDMVKLGALRAILRTHLSSRAVMLNAN